ncbi:MAG TPA: hypothetical protein VEL31_17185 [Ktedonobacteraceae bacterium]|nr:hypothetical protein [Ktedonobacteraceae bacterium]
MDTALTVAILGAVVTAIGWLVTHILSTSTERRRQRLIAQVDFTKQQLEELYGPLAFLTLEGEQASRDLMEALGRNYVFLDDYIEEDALKIWLFWVENDFFPRHQKIVDLLSSKTHLIEGERMPKSYLEFLNHHHSWKINHERWQKQGIPYSWHSKIDYPREFDKEVVSTFEHLKKRHSILIGKISKEKNLPHSFRRNRT